MIIAWTDRDGVEWNISSSPVMEKDPASPVSERDYRVLCWRAGESLRLRVCRRAGWSNDDLSDGELQHLLDEPRGNKV